MAVITTLILTRHGEANCNVAGIVGGDRACTGLTDRGGARWNCSQAACTPRNHATCCTRQPDAAPESRRRILSGKLGLPVHIEPGLTGPHHGDADGRPWGEIKTAFGGPPSL